MNDGRERIAHRPVNGARVEQAVAALLVLVMLFLGHPAPDHRPGHRTKRIEAAQPHRRVDDEPVADDAGRAELNAFYDNLNQIHRLQGGELAKVLGVQLGFNAHDGD